MKTSHVLEEETFPGNNMLNPEEIFVAIENYSKNTEIQTKDHDSKNKTTCIFKTKDMIKDFKKISSNQLVMEAQKTNETHYILPAVNMQINQNHLFENQTKTDTKTINIIEKNRSEALRKQRDARYQRLKTHLSQLLFIEEQIRAASAMIENEMKRCKSHFAEKE